MYIKSDLAKAIPLPKPTDNKYSRGKCVFLAGSVEYPGAACLAAWASQYMGAGYTEVYTAEGNQPIIQINRPSLVVRSFNDCAPKKLIPSDRRGAIVFGPGIDVKDTQAEGLFMQVLKKTKHPLLIDGGGLTFLADHAKGKTQKMRKVKQLTTVLTPHDGEAVRLAKPFKISMDDRYKAAEELAKAYNAIVVLKGPETIITNGTKTEIFTFGTPALAKAGTGDVLAGIIGALLAQGVAPFQAAFLGVALHAQAGKFAAAGLTEVCVCAEEVVEALPAAIGSFLDRLDA